MTRIAQVNLSFNPKVLWFDAGDFDLHTGDGVIVTTARGTEFGRVAGEVFEADDEQIAALKSPLKSVQRIATQEDEVQADEMYHKSLEALPIFKEMAAEVDEDMRPVSVEFLFDGDKAVFYFESEDRIDFRDLVRKLAAHFHVRVDMRQIGVRDEARMVGGLGHCGQELCCKRMGGDFNPVSIRMAKEQDLSLNPQKISGVCGRLMCCLRYEFDAYKDFKSRAPKQNAQITTPDGIASVIDLDVPREVISLKIEDEKPVKVPLADFDEAPDGQRPNSVGKEAWEAANARESFDLSGSAAVVLSSQLTSHDDSSSAVQESNQNASKSARGMSSEGSSKAAKANGSSRSRGSNAQAAQKAGASSSARKPRPRRSTTLNSAKGNETVSTSAASKQAKKSVQQSPSRPKASTDVKQGPRPGQKSSGLRGTQQQTSQGGSTGNAHRRMRRSHKAGNGQGS